MDKLSFIREPYQTDHIEIDFSDMEKGLTELESWNGRGKWSPEKRARIKDIIESLVAVNDAFARHKAKIQEHTHHSPGVKLCCKYSECCKYPCDILV